ncbi:MAG TPA: HEAT repeat domain-containing protein [Terriglobales bacterium]|nr:HEAT repeat domain-containing protein [Terriglobales bacterium]
MDELALSIRHHWHDVISLKIRSERWRKDQFKRSVVERLVLDRIETAAEADRKIFQDFIRRSALMEKRVWEARSGSRHQRRDALLALGRTRMHEFVPLLEEAIEDRDAYLQEAATRALGQIGGSAAALAILRTVASDRLRVSQLTVKDALVRCSRSDPKLLLRFLNCDRTTHLLIARVLGEVANADVGDELALLARDTEPEIRASAARGLAHAEPLFAISALSELAMDEVWFVRLRAVVSLAGLHHPASMPALLATICDINRSVRQRTASALAQLPKELLPTIIDRVASTRDKYALHALISELERTGECSGLMLQLSDKQALESEDGRNLLRAVEEARKQIAENRAGVTHRPEPVVGHA